MIYPFFNYILTGPLFVPTDNRPPTIYTILESIVNPDVDLNDPAPEVKIKDLAKAGRTTIFNFDYPLTSNISRETFEKMILNHFLYRRIGFETVTAFRIQLDVKLNEIMPKYNKLFDALENWDIFNDGEVTARKGEDISQTQNKNELTNTSINNTENISDRRFSDTPQNQLQNIRDGSYVTKYNYDTDTAKSNDNSNSQGKSNTDSNNKYWEETKRSPADKIKIYQEMQYNIKSIYTLIFEELECLFYQLL